MAFSSWTSESPSSAPEPLEVFPFVLFQSLPFATRFHGRTDIKENFTQYSVTSSSAAEAIEASVYSLDDSRLSERNISIATDPTPSTATTGISPLPPVQEEEVLPTSTVVPPVSSSFLSFSHVARRCAVAPSSLREKERETHAFPCLTNTFRGRHLLGMVVSLPCNYVVTVLTPVKEDMEEVEPLLWEKGRTSRSFHEVPRVTPCISPSCGRPLECTPSMGSGSSSRRKRFKIETTPPSSFASPLSSVSYLPTTSTTTAPITVLRKGKDKCETGNHNSSCTPQNKASQVEGTSPLGIPLRSRSVTIWGHDRLPDKHFKAAHWIQLAEEIHSSY